ncbi:MAG TPA: anaerobic glycerol-3-phosphate dehydrogenase subunit C [Spirochaetes bacterium]|nr:anaerobic glycerol-3-phosphate dehydrogenase subunit C [Spirochaetota bacterium]
MIKLENISFDHCIKCTVCTVYCPVARATHHFPGPKQCGPDTERLRIKNPELLDQSLKYCTNCKRCEIACPSDVKIADLIQSSKWRYSRNRFRLRDYILSHTDLMGAFGTALSLVVNFFTSLGLVKFFLQLFFRIPSARAFPSYARGTFRRWYRTIRNSQNGYDQQVVYFHGCYVNYNFHRLGKDVIGVLNALGVGVMIQPEKCCGVPLIANGFIDKARKNAAFNIASLSGAVKDTDMKIVSSSSSCTLALKHEYANLLEMDNSAINGRVEYISRYLLPLVESRDPAKMRPVPLRAAYHSPCHLERMGGVIHTVNLLRKIPGLQLRLLHSECCGIAGTYGFKSEYYKISQSVGENLFKMINSIDPDIVITDCETCKWQIEMNTPYRVVHPVSVLAIALSVNDDL